MHQIRQHYRDDLERLEQQVLGTLELVVSQLDQALKALRDQDARLVRTVVASDDRIDARYLDVHRGILSLLARQSPVAGDLRMVAALLHVNRCVERIGDQCVNIAKLVPLSGEEPPTDATILDAIASMGVLAHTQLEQTRRVLELRSVELARDLAAHDAEINGLNRAIFRRATQIGGDPELREWAMFMVLVARCLERIGDNAVDIAEQVAFVVTGLFPELVENT